MPLYPAGQLIGKTILLKKPVHTWKVSDINSIGDKAKPIGTLKSGTQFIMDSFLLPAEAHTNPLYNIKYAERKYTYFTYFSGDNYMAIRLDEGGIDRKALKAQGALTVEEVREKEERENMSAIDRFLSDLNITGTLKTIVKIGIVLAVVYILVAFIIPAYKKHNK